MKFLNRINFLNILRLLTWVTVFVMFFIVCFSAVDREKEKVCQQLIVSVDNVNDNYFVDEGDVRKLLLMEDPHLVGERIAKIDFKRIENSVNKNDFIEQTEMVKTVKGDVIVSVEQKNPILRVINYKGMNYYVSDKWKWMPTSNKFTKRTPLITGYVGDITQPKNERDSILVVQLKQITAYIFDHPFWNAMISEIHVNAAGKIELTPQMEDFKILFGTVDGSMEQKFKKLEIFYRDGLKYVLGSQYQAIDISFKNQIVGIKKETIIQNKLDSI